MYTFFYPEDNRRLLSDIEFQTVDEAVDYWRERYMVWKRIAVQSPRDKAAFIYDFDGSIVVIRAVGAGELAEEF